MSKNYTTRTASLRATEADIRTLKVKKLIVDGETAGGGSTGSESSINLPEDYYKFVGRTQLSESSSYKLIDDNANVIYNNSNA